MIGIVSSSLIYGLHKVLPFVATDVFYKSSGPFFSTPIRLDSYDSVPYYVRDYDDTKLSSSQETTRSIDSGYYGVGNCSEDEDFYGDWTCQDGEVYGKREELNQPLVGFLNLLPVGQHYFRDDYSDNREVVNA